MPTPPPASADSPTSDGPPSDSQAYLVAFRHYEITEDGEHVVFQVVDPQGVTGHIALPWRELGALAHLLNQAGVDIAQRRLALDKDDDFTGVGAAQLVAKFLVNDVPERNARIVSLVSPTGLRSDFAISHEQKDQHGRPLLHAMASALTK